MTQPAYAMGQANFAEMYERFVVGPLFRPWVDLLLDRVKLAPGDRVLDVACGTGIVARVAKERLGSAGRVVGVDVSEQMLAVARGVDPTIEWREGNALSLPFDAGEFDVVLCQQGMQFFSDKAAAAREMRRVLAPGGRMVLATWRDQSEMPFFLALYRVAERRLGRIDDQRFGLGDGALLERLLAEAGFRDVRVETVTRTIRFAEPATFIGMNAMALVGMSSASATMTEEERHRAADAIVQDSADVSAPYAEGAGVAVEIGTNVATALT